MRQIKTSIIINAPRENVWKILLDTASWREWNPFAISVIGEPREGNKIDVSLKLPGNKNAMVLQPVVTKIQVPEEFRWFGHLVIPGVFDGEHIFQLEETDEKTTKFHQSEIFGGFLSGIILKFIEAKTIDGFNHMNKALKQRAESM